MTLSIPRHVTDLNFHNYLLERKQVDNYGRVISRLLYLLKGAIKKFVLCMNNETKLDDEDINHWILFLSTKGIKDLTFQKWNVRPPLKLPTHLFSCLELKHLKLVYCSFNPPARFHGFPNLLSLNLSCMQFESGSFGDSFTKCPILEILNVRSLDPSYKVKPVEIAKLTNLKILSLSVRNLDSMMMTSSGSIFELVGLLPKLKELDLDFEKCKFTEDAARKRSPISFPCLKALKLTEIDLGNSVLLSFAFELIRCSPNMQTLEITVLECDADPLPATLL